MTSGLTWLNELASEDATNELLKCCGSTRWATGVTRKRPFGSLAQLSEAARNVWGSLAPEDWLEAFRSHPRIGEKKADTEQGAVASVWSEQEQSGIARGSDETLEELANLNRRYEATFGYIFIICASGKSSDDILKALRARLGNDREAELRVAAAEQAKITELRLLKLLGETSQAFSRK